MQCLRGYDTPHLSAENLTRKNSQPGFLNEEPKSHFVPEHAHCVASAGRAIPGPPCFSHRPDVGSSLWQSASDMVRTRSRPGLWKHGTPVSSRFMRLI